MSLILLGLCLSMIGSSGFDDQVEVYFDGDFGMGNYAYAIVQVISYHDMPGELVWTSGHVSPGGSYIWHACTGSSWVNGKEPFHVTCTYYDDHGQPLPNVALITGIYFPEDFTVVGVSDYYCTNDF